jgi:hypothetical protein
MAKSHVMRALLRATGLALALAGMLATLIPAQASASTCTQDLVFTEKDLEYSKAEGYDVIALRGARFLNRPGEPRLPLVPIRLALPAGAEVCGFSLVVRDSSELQGDFVVWPSQPPQSLSPVPSSEFVPPLEAVYESDKRYPECAAEMVGWGRLGGVTVCDLLVYPLRYHPASRKVVLLREIEVEVEYDLVPEDVDGTASRWCPEMLTGLVANPHGAWRLSARKMSEAPPLALGGETVSYLIVTCDSLRSYFKPLADWKTRKGVPAAIITVEEIAARYSGCDLQERIRNCLKEYHSKYETDWVLLGGDTQIVPDRKAYVPLSDKPYLPCDLYYSDLDGTWNADGDLYWGEVPSDNVDMYADVFVGRAPVSNRGEVRTFVDKVLTYEGARGLPQDFQLGMLFAGEILWGDLAHPSDPEYTDGGVAKDLVHTLYVPERFSLERRYESLGNLSRASVMEILNQGVNIINILAHGQYHSISTAEDALTETDFQSLLNGPRYGLLYAAACLSGGFDQSRCIGESWVLSPGGGGFFIGNSRYGWNCPGFPGEGPSDYYDQSFFESVFVTGFTNLGKAHADAKHEFVGESKTDLYMRYLMFGLNLLGDPETRLWTDRPREMDIAFEDVLTLGPRTFEVVVTSEGAPVGGARVCLSKDDDVYCVEESDYEGRVYAFIDPAGPGTLHVTATKRDCLPAIGEASVVVDMPPARPEGVSARDALGPAAIVTWSPVDDSDLAAYRIYRNTLSLPESLTSVSPAETTYCDTEVVDGTLYYYWVSGVDSMGIESALSEPCSLLVGGSVSVPTQPGSPPEISIAPNPFTETVQFCVRRSSITPDAADVFDVAGRWVCRVGLEDDGRGGRTGRWDGKNASGRKITPGIYVVRLEGEVVKVIFLR